MQTVRSPISTVGRFSLYAYFDDALQVSVNLRSWLGMEMATKVIATYIDCTGAERIVESEFDAGPAW